MSVTTIASVWPKPSTISYPKLNNHGIPPRFKTVHTSQGLVIGLSGNDCYVNVLGVKRIIPIEIIIALSSPVVRDFITDLRAFGMTVPLDVDKDSLRQRAKDALLDTKYQPRKEWVAKAMAAMPDLPEHEAWAMSKLAIP